MKSPQAPTLRLELRFHEASDDRLYAHLTAMPPRLRAEFLRHLTRLGWLVHTGQGVPGFSPTSEIPGNVQHQPRSMSGTLDQELLAALERPPKTS